jgi:hypothetical protein
MESPLRFFDLLDRISEGEGEETEVFKAESLREKGNFGGQGEGHSPVPSPQFLPCFLRFLGAVVTR